MSAYLDKSQGITFVYSNIFQMYQKAKDAKLDAPFVVERPSAPGPTREPQGPRVLKSAEAKAFAPQELEAPAGERTLAVPEGFRETDEKEKAAQSRPLANLQKNLAELSNAHERLRFLLQELDSLTKKK